MVSVFNLICKSLYQLMCTELTKLHIYHFAVRVKQHDNVTAAAIFEKEPIKTLMSSVFFLLYVHVICNFVCHPIGSKRCNLQWERKRNLSRERTGHILSGVTCKPVSRVIWFCKSALQLNDLGHTHA